MTDPPDVDTLEATLEHCIRTGRWSAFGDDNQPERQEYLAALSDLAARARGNLALAEHNHDAAQAQMQRAEAAEADRDRLEADRDAWRNSCLDAQERLDVRREAQEAAEADRDRLQAQIDEAEQESIDSRVKADRLARRVTELEAAVRAWDATLSEYCDGPERDAVRALLAGDEGGARPRGIDPTHGDDLRRAGLLPDVGGA